MRLILHRNLKPENLLYSTAGELKLCDFGQFRDATPYWAPERKAGPYADLRGDLFSLGTIFKELMEPGDAELDALLQKMTRVETFERVQMIEDVISKLESRVPSTPAPTYSPPVYSAPSPPVVPAWQAPDPGLIQARTSLVSTLAAVARTPARIPAPRIERPIFTPPPLPPPPPKIEIPVVQAPPPPPPKPRPAPPPYVPPPPPPPPRPTVPRRRSGPGGVLKTLLAMAVIGLWIAFSMARTNQRREEQKRQVEDGRRFEEAEKAQRKLADPSRKDAGKKMDKLVVEKTATVRWESARKEIQGKDAEGHSAEALADLDQYLDKNRGTAPEEAAQLRKSLQTWVATVKQAEQSWKYGGDKRAADLLAKAGPERAKDAERLIAAWCDQDWEKVKVAVDQANTNNDPYTANLEVERFLHKVHLGGAHKKEAEELQKRFQADLDWSDVADRVAALKSRAPADAAAALEAFLAKPHQGGTHRIEVQKQIAQLKEEAELLLYSGRSSIARLTVSPETRRVLFTADGIRIYDLEERHELGVIPQRSLLRGLSAGCAGMIIAVGTSSKISVWSELGKAELRSFSPASGYVVGVEFKDQKLVYAALSDGSLVTWDCSVDDPPKIEKDVAPGVTHFAMGRDFLHLAFASRDRTLRVRDLKSGKDSKWAGPPMSMSALAISPDGRTVGAGSANGLITFWTVESGEAGPAVTGHKGTVTCADFSPSGTVLATGGADGVIRLTSVKDGSELRLLKGHQGRVTSVAYLAGTLISSGSDGTIRIWPLK